MIKHSVAQGTQQWLDLRANHFTASEAAAMMGDSKYQSRQALLAEKTTGIRKEITPAQQKIFDKGHAAEAAARPLIEQLIDEDLFPIVATEGELLASFDGLTIDDAIVFEHKLYNKTLFQQVLSDRDGGGLEPHHFWQLEQQLLVSDAEKAVFVCSDGTSDSMAICWYQSKDERRQALLAGWKQFKDDLAEYKAGIESGEIKPPVLETIVRHDDLFKGAESEYMAALDEMAAAKSRMDDAKQNLINLSDGVKTKGSVVQLYPVNKQGSISWQKAFKAHCPNIPAKELEAFKGKNSVSWTVKQL